MILSQPDLRRAVEDGRVAFNPPLLDDQWGPASVDLRLGFSFTRWRPGLEGVKLSVAQGLASAAQMNLYDTVVLPEQDRLGQRPACVLEPGGFVLAMTHEVVSVPADMIALVEGRSTYARVGLSMHQTAPWIQPGWVGSIILEIRNSGPLTIELTPLLDRPCQLTFFQLSSAVPADLAYGTQPGDVYQRQRHPLKPSRAKSPRRKR